VPPHEEMQDPINKGCRGKGEGHLNTEKKKNHPKMVARPNYRKIWGARWRWFTTAKKGGG